MCDWIDNAVVSANGEIGSADVRAVSSGLPRQSERESWSGAVESWHAVSEFTGERVIPGQVNDDLWAEHVARYAFAARFAAGRRVLDLGAAPAMEPRNSRDARLDGRGHRSCAGSDRLRRVHISLPHEFLNARRPRCPFPPASFDLVTAFEVIEHLTDWRALLAEARRVLRPDGVCSSSPPRTSATTRNRGPRRDRILFTRTNSNSTNSATPGRILSARRRFCFRTASKLSRFIDGTPAARSDAEWTRRRAIPKTANFFIGVCSCGPLPTVREFSLRAARRQSPAGARAHINARAICWNRETRARAKLPRPSAGRANRWAQICDRWKQLSNACRAAKGVSGEQARGADRVIAELNQENQRKTEWALETEQRLTQSSNTKRRNLQKPSVCSIAPKPPSSNVRDWAQQLDAQLRRTTAQLAMVRQSRWLKLGRQLGLGPQASRKPAE